MSWNVILSPLPPSLSLSLSPPPSLSLSLSLPPPPPPPPPPLPPLSLSLSKDSQLQISILSLFCQLQYRFVCVICVCVSTLKHYIQHSCLPSTECTGNAISGCIIMSGVPKCRLLVCVVVTVQVSKYGGGHYNKREHSSGRPLVVVECSRRFQTNCEYYCLFCKP